MQLSGPWPPYHFVHRLTRGLHGQQQPAAQLPVAMSAGLPPIQIPEAVAALV